MIKIRKSEERGHYNYGWLDTFHTFSFARYHDPDFVNFKTLRVLNEDRVEAGGEFGSHPHENMEIISYILDGELTHEDNMGNGSAIRRGDVQRMTAGSGVVHSEANRSEADPVHFFQIWFFPGKKNLKPSYEQKHFSEEAKLNSLCLVASPDGKNDSLTINQKVNIFASLLEAGKQLKHNLGIDRYAWIQVASGRIKVNNTTLDAGDGASIGKEEELTISSIEKSEFLLIEMF